MPALSARIGPTTTVGAAFACIGGGLLGLSTSHQDTTYAAYAGWLLLIGVGVTLALPGLTHDIAAALPSVQAGVGAGLQATTRELGSAIGVAVVGTVLTSRFSDRFLVESRVDSVDWIAPRLRHVVLKGPQLTHLRWNPGQHVRVQVGHQRAALDWVIGAMRTYTIWTTTTTASS